MSHPTNPYLDRGRLQTLQLLLMERLDDLVGSLSADLRRHGKALTGPCPVHGGDNPHALYLYREGHTAPGYWRCYTRGCQEYFHKNVLGFVRGVLSHQRLNWGPGGKTVGWVDTVKHCLGVVGKKIGEIIPSLLDDERTSFVRNVNLITAGARPAGVWARQEVVSRLRIPAPYFVQRGWGERVLTEYDVGVCEDRTKPFFGRAVAPIYDEHGWVVGATGRSVHPQCPSCKAYHPGGCGDPRQWPKWRHTGKTPIEFLLYNWWRARKVIPREGYAILVEGPGDLWRLEEAGFHTGLGLFGASLSDPQQVLLETSGAMSLIVLTDEDAAGVRARQTIKERLSRSFNVINIGLPKNDLGEMSVQEVRDALGPVVEGVKKRFS